MHTPLFALFRSNPKPFPARKILCADSSKLWIRPLGWEEQSQPKTKQRSGFWGLQSKLLSRIGVHAQLSLLTPSHACPAPRRLMPKVQQCGIQSRACPDYAAEAVSLAGPPPAPPQRPLIHLSQQEAPKLPFQFPSSACRALGTFNTSPWQETCQTSWRDPSPARKVKVCLSQLPFCTNPRPPWRGAAGANVPALSG